MMKEQFEIKFDEHKLSCELFLYQFVINAGQLQSPWFVISVHWIILRVSQKTFMFLEESLFSYLVSYHKKVWC